MLEFVQTQKANIQLVCGSIADQEGPQIDTKSKKGFHSDTKEVRFMIFGKLHTHSDVH